MQRLEMIDDIRKYANLLMLEDPKLDYAKATDRAKMEIFGQDLNVPKYSITSKGVEVDVKKEKTLKDIAFEETGGVIKVELYTEEQLKEIIIAKRMGVQIEEFVNIFYTPEQIRVITLAYSMGKDITSYTNNLYFDPKSEMKKLEEDAKVYVLESKN